MLTASHVASQLGGVVIGDSSTPLHGVAPAASAREGDLTFAEKPEYLALAEQSAASGILVPLGSPPSTKLLIQVADPRVAMVAAISLFHPPESVVPGIHPSALVDKTATIAASASIGPNCVVGANTTIGERTVLKGSNHIGNNVRIRDDVRLHPCVTIYSDTHIGHRVIIHAGTTIGSDGYGYVFDKGRHQKVPQIGSVTIGDDVEIGANSAVDRGALGVTQIGEGTKLDNLVHVAHNVVIGRHCLIMGQVGIAGSTTIGDYAMIASQSGIAGHLTIGPQVKLGAKSGVMRDIPAGGTYLGVPAAPDRQTKRQWIALEKLPSILKKLRALEK